MPRWQHGESRFASRDESARKSVQDNRGSRLSRLSCRRPPLVGVGARGTAMLFYDKHIYSRLVRVLGNPKPIREIRERLIPLAQGEVLEIGVGPGTNFVHYDPARVSRLYALEPNPEMIRLAERQRRRTGLNVEYLGLPGECIPLGE